MPEIRILLIDDDKEYAQSLSRLLGMEGFSVECEHTAESGYRAAMSGQYDMLLLDVMLPDGDGRSLLRRIRLSNRVPVIMLTARGDEADRIGGLEGGADDYLPKPFNPRELIARMRSVLRRQALPLPPRTLQLGDLEIHTGTRSILQQGQEVALTGAEFDILLLLISSAGEVVSRDDIAQQALGRNIAPFDRSVDNHVSNLRKKLGAQYNGIERIRSVRGNGYIYANTDWNEKP